MLGPNTPCPYHQLPLLHKINSNDLWGWVVVGLKVSAPKDLFRKSCNLDSLSGFFPNLDPGWLRLNPNKTFLETICLLSRICKLAIVDGSGSSGKLASFSK